MFYLKPKKIKIEVGNNYIVLLNENTAHQLDLHSADRVYIKNGRAEVIAIVDISPMMKDSEIGLFEETWNKLKVARGDHRVSVTIARKPESIKYIKEKLDGKRLSQKKIDIIIGDVVKEKTLSDVELTYFVAAIHLNKLDDKETVSLTKAIVKSGKRLKFKNGKIIFDKHCIGGVPGNRTTPIVVPICAAAGLTVPKTSSRAITSPAGTADTMEVMTNVKNDTKKLAQIIKKVGAFMTWGGNVDLASADDHLISVRHPLSLDPQGMLLASILAKKHAVSANHILIDIPYGKKIKVKTKKDAQPLKHRFEKIAKLLGMKIKVIITDGKQPIGNGIGPILECIEIIKVLRNEPDAPKDLRKKSIMIAGISLELCKVAKKGQGQKMARELLTSGKAYKKFMEIIRAQGEKKTPLIPGKYSHDIKSTKKGKITGINNKLISKYARFAGAPRNMGAGIFIHKKIGEKVKKGTKLFTIYAESSTRLENTIENIEANDCYHIK